MISDAAMRLVKAAGLNEYYIVLNNMPYGGVTSFTWRSLKTASIKRKAPLNWLINVSNYCKWMLKIKK